MTNQSPSRAFLTDPNAQSRGNLPIPLSPLAASSRSVNSSRPRLSSKQDLSASPGATTEQLPYPGDAGAERARQPFRKRCDPASIIVPFGVILVVFATSLSMLTGFLSWWFTYRGGYNSSISFAQSLQAEQLANAVSNLQSHLDEAVRLAHVQQSRWRAGTYQYSNKTAVLHDLRMQLQQYTSLVATQTFTTYPQGELWGYYWPYGANYWVQWQNNLGNYTEWHVDPVTDQFITQSDSAVGRNDTQSQWVTIVDPTNSSSVGWTPIYLWGNDAWLSCSVPIYNTAGTFMGVATTDMDLYFVNSILQSRVAQVAQSGRHASMYVFETGTEALLGTSVTVLGNTIDTNIDPNRPLNLSVLASKGADPALSALSSTLHVQGTNLTAMYASGQRLLLATDQNGGSYYVYLDGVSTGITQWVLVQILPQADILQTIKSASVNSLVAVTCIVLAGVGLFIGFSLYTTRTLRRITRDLDLLTKFQFHEVIKASEGYKSKSSILEIRAIQQQLFVMVKAFARALKDSKLVSGTAMSSAAPAAGQSTSPSLSPSSGSSAPPVPTLPRQYQAQQQTQQSHLTLRQVLLQPTVLSQFKYYLRNDLAEENLVFLQLLAEMRSSNAENPEPLSMSRDVRALIDEFFLASSPMELNLTGKARREVVAMGKQLCDDLELLQVCDAETLAAMAGPRKSYSDFANVKARDQLSQVLTRQDLLHDPFLVFLIAERHIEGVLSDRLKAFSLQMAKQAIINDDHMPIPRAPRTTNQTRVVIIGGGFCGALVAQLLDPMSRFHVTLIDTKSYFEYTPSVVRLIPDPKADSIMYEHSEYIRNGQLVVAMVNEVTPTHVIAGNGQHVLPFDYLVVASGSSYASNLKADHMSSSYRAKKITNEHARLDNARTVLVVGGGIVGVEVAAEIKSVYPNKQVTMVEANERLLKRNSRNVHATIFNHLTKTLGICVVLGDRLTSYDQAGQEFVGHSGTHYSADMVYICTGQTPRSDFMRRHFGEHLDDRGYINVTKSHQLADHPNIFCGGDVCSINDERMASMARFAAVSIARNICRLAKEKRAIPRGSKGTKPPTPQTPAQFVSLGKDTGAIILNYKTALIGPKWLRMKLSFKDKTFAAFDQSARREKSYPLFMRVVYGRPPRALTGADQKQVAVANRRSLVRAGSVRSLTDKNFADSPIANPARHGGSENELPQTTLLDSESASGDLIAHDRMASVDNDASHDDTTNADRTAPVPVDSIDADEPVVEVLGSESSIYEPAQVATPMPALQVVQEESSPPVSRRETLLPNMSSAGDAPLSSIPLVTTIDDDDDDAVKADAVQPQQLENTPSQVHEGSMPQLRGVSTHSLSTTAMKTMQPSRSILTEVANIQRESDGSDYNSDSDTSSVTSVKKEAKLARKRSTVSTRSKRSRKQPPPEPDAEGHVVLQHNKPRPPVAQVFEKPQLSIITQVSQQSLSKHSDDGQKKAMDRSGSDVKQPPAKPSGELATGGSHSRRPSEASGTINRGTGKRLSAYNMQFRNDSSGPTKVPLRGKADLDAAPDTQDVIKQSAAYDSPHKEADADLATSERVRSNPTLDKARHYRSVRSIQSRRSEGVGSVQELRREATRKKRLKVENERAHLGWWQLRLYNMHRMLRGWSMYHKNGVFNIWADAIKGVESRCGAGIASYFVLLKWVFFLNLVLGVLWISPIMSIHVLSMNDPAVVNGTHTGLTYAQQYYDPASWSWGWDGAVSFFTGAGQYNNTPLFYQSYYPIMLNNTYRMDLAYLLVFCITIVASFVAILRKMRAEYVRKASSSTGSEEDDAYPFSVLAFCSWPFGHSSESVQEGQRMAITMAFKALLSRQELELEAAHITKQQRILLVVRRVIGTVLSIGVLCTVGLVLYDSVRECSSPTNATIFRIVAFVTRDDSQFTDFCAPDPGTGLSRVTPYPPYLVSVSNIITPSIFYQLSKFERHADPQWEGRITLMRSYLIKISAIYFLLYNIGLSVFSNTTSSYECWEHDIAQRFYTLAWLDSITYPVMAVTFGFFYKRVLNSYGFDIVAESLELVYRQGVIWMGMLFAPVMPAVGVVSSVILFYTQLWIVRTFADIPKRIFNTYSQILWFMVFMLATLALMVKPSNNCGPYRHFPNYPFTFSSGQGMYYVIPQAVNAIQASSVKTALSGMGLIGVVAVLVPLLSIWVYWLRAILHKRTERLNKLEVEVKEGRDDMRNLVRFYGVQT
ncbi:Transmembrane channel-like [Sorochytrium milnesiophthora]